MSNASPAQAATIDTTPVDLGTAASIEAAEATAWADLYAAAPRAWADEVGLGTRRVGEALVIRWAATGRRYFNRAIGLGVIVPASAGAVDEILEGYAQAGISMFLLQSLPHCRPHGYERWLAERGLEIFDTQDRVVRDGSPLVTVPPGSDSRELMVETVTRETADEWAEFIQRVYRLDTGRWLQQLVERPGWRQYVAREGGRLVGARGMYIGADGTAWLGMDGPVPGVTTQDYEPDAVLCAAIVADGLARGARRFIADIEAPSASMDTPAYRYFSQLGFGRPYVRSHWTRV
jgi:hypothetical protein